MQQVRYKGTKYKEEILRALQGIDQAEDRDREAGEGGERVKEGLERTLHCKDYVWKKKETHDVSVSVKRDRVNVGLCNSHNLLRLLCLFVCREVPLATSSRCWTGALCRSSLVARPTRTSVSPSVGKWGKGTP